MEVKVCPKLSKVYNEYVGYHTKKEKTVKLTLEKYHKEYNFNRHCQIFMGSKLGGNIRWSEEDSEEVKKYLSTHNTKFYIHAPYTINFSDITQKSKESLINNLVIGSKYNASGVVFHVGKSKKMDKKEATEKMYAVIKEALTHCNKDTPFLLETPAGQGTELLQLQSEFSDFCLRFKGCESFGVCIDTCHIFASGYDINDYTENFKKTNPGQLKLIHLNNSKCEKGSKKDRHCSFFKSEGHISQEECFKFIQNNKGTSMIRE